MKSTIKTLLIGSLLISSFIKAQAAFNKNTDKTIECLKVTGLALDEKDLAIDGVEVRLFKQNDMMEQIEITSVEHHDHSFNFTLEANEYYTIKVSKPGFVERWVVFYTELPVDVNIETPFRFEFEVVLFKEKQMDDYYLDFPIALVRFNKKTSAFKDNTNYTKFIKTKIKDAEEEAKLKRDVSINNY